MDERQRLMNLRDHVLQVEAPSEADEIDHGYRPLTPLSPPEDERRLWREPREIELTHSASFKGAREEAFRDEIDSDASVNHLVHLEMVLLGRFEKTWSGWLVFNVYALIMFSTMRIACVIIGFPSDYRREDSAQVL